MASGGGVPHELNIWAAQFGTEDQGWVAHFLIRALKGEPITLYGDGKQMRDILFADDLIDAFLLAQANMPRMSGQAFNIGGGAGNTISLIELLDLIEELHGHRPDTRPGAWRRGTSDITCRTGGR